MDSYEIGAGYGHIVVISDDLDATLAKLTEPGIEQKKTPYSVWMVAPALCRERPR